MPYALDRGSEWHKWDLHIHSPLSALNNQFPMLSDGSPDWDRYIAALAQLTDIPGIAITDYFSIDGYKTVRAAKEAGNFPQSAYCCLISNSELTS